MSKTLVKEALLKKLADKLKSLIHEQGISVKELSKLSGISYTTLNPILNGTQECGFTKIILLAQALNVPPNELLDGLYIINSSNTALSLKARYYAVFITTVKVSYCLLFDIATKEKTQIVSHSPLRCSEHPNMFIEHIQSAIEKLSSQLNKKISLKEIAIFLSVLQYGREQNRLKIENLTKKLFYKVILQPDHLTDYHAFFGNKNGICISINDGDAITFSISKSKNKEIETLHSYGFPISDVAGNFWLGCEAIKHAIRVEEGLDASSPLSDRLLAIYNNDIYFLSASTMEDSSTHYTQASALVKEFFHQQKKSYEIVKKSAQLLMENVTTIDRKFGKPLPICLSGELAYLYEEFFPEKRLLKISGKQSDVLLQHGLNILSNNT